MDPSAVKGGVHRAGAAEAKGVDGAMGGKGAADTAAALAECGEEERGHVLAVLTPEQRSGVSPHRR